MSVTDSKAIDKRVPGDGRDRGFGGRYKDTGGNNPFKKPRFTGDTEDLKDCVFDCEDEKQANAFEGNIKKLSTYAATKYDMGAIIMTMIDEMADPKMTRPFPYLGSDPIESKIYELRITQFINNQQKLESECKKLYTVVLGQCTNYMLAKLKALTTFKEMHNEKDPIKLLKSIKGLTFKFDNEKEYEMSLVEAIDKFYRIYQTKEMSNTQFMDKFNNLIDVIEHYGGTIGVHKKITNSILAKHTKGVYDEVNWKLVYTDDQIQQATDEGKERMLARMFLNRVDRARYGTMLIKLHNDYVTGRHDIYPNNRVSAFALINNWHYEKEKPAHNSHLDGASFTQDGTRPSGGFNCWGCGKEGVTLAQCTNASCMKKYKAKQDRKQPTYDQGQQHLNMEMNNETESKTYLQDDSDKDYCGYDVGVDFHQGNDSVNNNHKKVGDSLILLDSQSTHSTFYAINLVTNVRNAVRPLRMTTNGGTIIYNQQADLPNYGTVWFNPNSIANIISMSEAERRGHQISYSPGCFKLFNDQTKLDMMFNINQSGLYAHTVPSVGLTLVQTVHENSQFFTPRQIESAKLARDLYQMIGRPSYNDFFEIVKNNLLPNVNITVKDIEHAEKIFGKELGSLQGKTVRSKPNAVITDYIEVPPAIMELHHEVTLAADIMNIDRMQFLITTSRNIQFTTVDRLENKEAPTLKDSIERVINLYKKRGFVVQTVLADNEFEILRDSLLKFGVRLNTCAPGEHIPEVERKIRTVKERVRGVVTTLPFKTIPLIITAHAIIFSVMWINFFPPKGGISNTLSPQAIVTGLSPNAEKHCKTPFGAYVQVHADNSQNSNNAMISRTVGAISLGPTGNIQGTYKFMSLLTGRLIKARSFTSLPMPDNVIAQVERMGESNYTSEYYNTIQNPIIAREEYRPPAEEDDASFESNDYSVISESEIRDINQEESIIGSDSFTPEVVTSDNNILNEGPDEILDEATQIQGVNDQNDGKSDEIGNSDIQDKPQTDYSNDIRDPGTSNDDIDHDEYDKELDDMSENVTNDESTRIKYITKRGRNVKLRKDLFDNYEFLQDGLSNVTSPNRSENISTQWSLKQGLRHFPKETKIATMLELKQLHEMKVFQPIHRSSMTRQEIIGTLRTLTFIKRKRCGRIKARTCADGRPQRSLYQKWESSSPTVRTESVLITSMLDAYEERVVGVYDIPGAFLHAKQTDLTYIKMTDETVKFLVEISQDTYKDYVTVEKGKEVLYLVLKKALYGCVKSALLFWQDLSDKLIKRGYVLNPYDRCVANKIVNNSQMTIVWHVDDLKVSHVDEAVLDMEVKWLESLYGSLIGGKSNCHTYLGIDMCFRNKKLQLSMMGYMREIIEEFPYELVENVATPAAPHLFDKDENGAPLNTSDSKIFHQVVAKVLWAATRVRPDLLTTLSYLTCQVKAPDQDDLKKLIRMISYIKNTIDLPLTIGMNDSCKAHWWVDASFGTRYQLRSQTGATFSLGFGSIYSMARKQKLNTTSSTEAELVGVHDAMSQIIWFRHFIKAQGIKLSNNILFQDNKSAILLHKNGTASSSRNTRHINIRYFFIKDRIKSGEVEINFCPSNEMVADFFTKPIQGKRFIDLRNVIMGVQLEKE